MFRDRKDVPDKSPEQDVPGKAFSDRILFQEIPHSEPEGNQKMTKRDILTYVVGRKMNDKSISDLYETIDSTEDGWETLHELCGDLRSVDYRWPAHFPAARLAEALEAGEKVYRISKDNDRWLDGMFDSNALTAFALQCSCDDILSLVKVTFMQNREDELSNKVDEAIKCIYEKARNEGVSQDIVNNSKAFCTLLYIKNIVIQVKKAHESRERDQMLLRMLGIF